MGREARARSRGRSRAGGGGCARPPRAALPHRVRGQGGVPLQLHAFRGVAAGGAARSRREFRDRDRRTRSVRCGARRDGGGQDGGRPAHRGPSRAARGGGARRADRLRVQLRALEHRRDPERARTPGDPHRRRHGWVRDAGGRDQLHHAGAQGAVRDQPRRDRAGRSQGELAAPEAGHPGGGAEVLSMRRLRDLSIRQKLTRVAMLSSSLALIFAATAFIAYDVLASRSAVARRLSTEAEIIASNTASALLFQDPAAARTTLAGLGAETHVRAAAVYDAHGHLFAHYAPDSSTATPAPLTRPLGDERHGRTAVVSRPILFTDKTVGTVVLEGDLEDMGTRLLRYASLVALVSAISFLLALSVSSRTQSVISLPILRLQDAARRGYAEKDY